MVIGGGTSGLGEGLFLSRLAKKIRIIRHSTQFTGFVLLQDKVRNHPQFEVHMNTEVRVFQGEGKVLAVVVRDPAVGPRTLGGGLHLHWPRPQHLVSEGP